MSSSSTETSWPATSVSNLAKRFGLHAFLLAISAVWLFPLAWTVYTSLRPYSDTAERGYVSLPGQLNLDNFASFLTQTDLMRYYGNTLIIVIPAVILTLFLASMVAFTVSNYSFRFNLTLLMLFVAGNLLPPQVIITPLYRLYLALPLPAPLSDNGLFYDQYIGIIAIQVAVQMGFCVFVLSSYMKAAVASELTEAAVVDGASAWCIFRRVVAPLCRPAYAALGTLLFTWIYNDFFWAFVLMRTGDKLPVTSALTRLSGEYFTNNNLVAAGSLLVAAPTIIVYLVLQRHFVSGLTLGSTKG